MTDLIRVDSVSKSFRRGDTAITVLEGLSFSMHAGEFVALMGPSGSGKTTLLNLIAGLDTPDSGSVVVGDAELSSLNDAGLAAWRSSHVGFVFQFYNLLPVLTAVENVALPLALFDMTQAERTERAKFALEITGLSDRMHHFPSQLSGGQEQRVAVARAIVTDPTLIVADEPTGDLDRHSATEVMELLLRLNTEFHKNILVVTHDQAVASFASRTVHLDKGQLKTA